MRDPSVQTGPTRISTPDGFCDGSALRADLFVLLCFGPESGNAVSRSQSPDRDKLSLG